jgi:murein DD-endopeptidase MepM/ murein hydrolase activator NlpD
MGLAVLLVIPVAAGLATVTPSAPAGQAVSVQEPTPARPMAPDALAVPSPRPSSSASPSPTAPVVLVETAVDTGATPPAAPPPPAPEVTDGVPHGRAWGELAGTRVPALDTLRGYRWPIAHPRLTLPFGPTPWGSRFVDGEPFHDGVDLATFCNDRIMAAHSGTVLAAGRHYDGVMGWVGDLQPYHTRLDRKRLWPQLPIVVVIDDGNGYRSIYAHMWKITVKKGDTVKAGQVIGYEGMTGRASGCHIHYGLFSPLETDTFRIRPDVVKRMKLPKEQIARVDPLLVLPPRAGINAPAKPKPKATETAAPSASAKP